MPYNSYLKQVIAVVYQGDGRGESPRAALQKGAAKKGKKQMFRRICSYERGVLLIISNDLRVKIEI